MLRGIDGGWNHTTPARIHLRARSLPPVIEHIEDLPTGCIGMRVCGEFTVDDFTSSIEPQIDDVTAQHDQLRLLLQLGEEFAGFGEGAWGELTDQIRQTPFHKGAVVTDDGHVSTAINVMKWGLHGHVRTFHNREFDKAVHWLST